MTLSPVSYAGPPTEVVTLGETMALMKADTPGPLQHVSSMSLGMGGAETNFAIALRRLGTTVTWVGRLGTDSLGDLVRRELAAEDIRVAGQTDSAAPTGLMIKERRTQHSQKVWYYRAGSAGSRLSPEDVPESLVRQARVLHVTGITPALSPSAADAVDHAISCAKASGTLVSFDLNYRANLWTPEQAAPVLRRLAAQADMVFAGVEEAELAVGTAKNPTELAARFEALGAGQAVIKLGEEGCLALIGGESYVQKAVPIVPVDTVGAGDAFVAGYINEFLAGSDVEQRLLTAVRTGAFACLVPGDWEGMPRRSELELLEETDPVTR